MTHTTSPSTPATDKSATIYAAIELSSKNWLLAIQVPDRKKISRHQVPAGDSAKLISHLEQAHARVQSDTHAQVRVMTCYEAGRDGFWLHRVLHANGIDSQIVAAASLLTDQKKKSAKTDRIDVHKILRALKLWHDGDPEAYRMVHVPTLAQEDERRTGREAQRIKKEKTEHINRTKSLTALHGIWTFKPLRRDWREQLEHLQTADGHPLPPRIKAEIIRECERLHYLRGQLKELAREDRARRREAKRSAEGKQPEDKTAREQRAELIAYLKTLRGVGETGASVLADEVPFGQAADRARVLGTVLRLERRQRRLGVGPAVGHPDRLHVGLGLRLPALGQLVQDVGGLVHPAPLLDIEAAMVQGDGQCLVVQRKLKNLAKNLYVTNNTRT